MNPSPEAPSLLLYRRLDTSQQQIRTLTLLAAEDDDEPIQCQMETVSLSTCHPFVALSYCWGSATDKFSIVYVNMTAVRVRQNLWQFLRSLRRVKGTIKIWVDYLCINQLDDLERGHQVKMMSKIYGKADAVIAWLGEGSPELEQDIERFSNMVRKRRAAGR